MNNEKRRRFEAERQGFFRSQGLSCQGGRRENNIEISEGSDCFFRQGDVAEAVFYIQKGKIKLTVVSERGKEAVVGLLERVIFLAKGA